MLEEFKITVPYAVDLSMKYVNKVETPSLDLSSDYDNINKNIEHYIRVEKVIGEGDFIRLYPLYDAVS